MKPSAVLKKLFTVACVYYAIFTLALLITISILSGEQFSETVTFVLNLLLLFPFSLALSGAEFLRKSNRMSGAIRMLLHYLIFAAAFLLFIWLPSAPQTITNAIIVLTLFSIIYWMVCLIVYLTAKRIRNIREE